MKRIIVLSLLFLSACAHGPQADIFVYKEIIAPPFVLASWQKITDVNKPFKFYIEGDGHAFNSSGRPSKDPTPKNKMFRNLAFKDSAPNVIYLARPCQYTTNENCDVKYWSGARFAPEVISSAKDAIKQTAGDGEIVLIGFSGGAQIAGLAALDKNLNVRRVVTVAGNLDHKAWAAYHKLPPLEGSLNLADYKEDFFKIPQKHYAGSKDKVIPAELIITFAEGKAEVEIVKNATHSKGYEDIKL